MKKDIKIRLLQKIFVLGIFVVLATGCSDDFLDVPPQGKQKSENFWQSKEDVSKAVNAMYAYLRSWPQVAFPAIAVESMPSDDAEKGSTPGDATFMNNFDRFSLTSTEGSVQEFWSGQYQEINLCNQVLDHADTIDFDESLKTRYIAEAKFLRAYSYFRLVRAFGAVPLRLHLPENADEYNLRRTSADSVYAAIEQDLTDAAAALPVSYGPADIGRATKGAALALHAKVCMYEKKWQQVFDLTNQVIGLGVYSLFPDFEQMFRIPNENCSESIFEIQCLYISGNADASNSQYSQVQADRDVNPSVGWGFNVPTQDLVDAFEPGDTRLRGTVLFAGSTTPEGDVVPPAGATTPSMYNMKSYVPFAVAQVTNQGAGQNVRVIRYAEVLLMNAEAANELSNTPQALKSLNAVRARARGNNPGVLPDITETDKDKLRMIIWHERRVELAMEYDRFFDLVRQGRAAEVLKSKGFTAGKNELMPIPQNEIDLSGGLLTQNPGY